MVDRRQAQQEQIARAAAEAAAARGETPTVPNPDDAPATVEVRVKPDGRKPNYDYAFGKAHGFSRDYFFDAANYFTQHLTPEDAEELRSRNDPRFSIKGGE